MVSESFKKNPNMTSTKSWIRTEHKKALRSAPIEDDNDESGSYSDRFSRKVDNKVPECPKAPRKRVLDLSQEFIHPQLSKRPCPAKSIALVLPVSDF